MRSLAKLSSGESVISPLTGRSAGQNETVTRMTVEFLISTTLVIAGAIWLARSADAIAQSTGLGGTFFGSIFLALVTSLPEMVVTISALRLGSLDLAIGNIFGSNMVNVFILSICDLASTTGPVIAKISPAHIVTVILSIAMTAIAIKGIYIKNKRTFFRLGWDTWAMTTFFIGGTALLYQIK
jgi:cation:H+ antiporter